MDEASLYTVPYISQLSNEKNSHTLTSTHKAFNQLKWILTCTLFVISYFKDKTVFKLVY